MPEPIFTPSTKAAVGDHDENISFAQCEAIVGKELAAQVRDTAIALYKAAAEYAASRGIIICDTKFEFGLDTDGTLTLMDEALTPDSSRFWPADSYVAEFSTALTKLSRGQVAAAPVKTQFGWHVIQLIDVRDAQGPSFDELKPQLAQRIQGAQLDAYLGKLKQQAKVE